MSTKKIYHAPERKGGGGDFLIPANVFKHKRGADSIISVIEKHNSIRVAAHLGRLTATLCRQKGSN